MCIPKPVATTGDTPIYLTPISKQWRNAILDVEPGAKIIPGDKLSEWLHEGRVAALSVAEQCAYVVDFFDGWNPVADRPLRFSDLVSGVPVVDGTCKFSDGSIVVVFNNPLKVEILC